jgi:hypothetical protein
MGQSIPCFFLEPAGKKRISLRRYVSASSPNHACSNPAFPYYHDAIVPIETITTADTPTSSVDGLVDVPRDDPRWPTHCVCGHAFSPDDEWDVWCQDLYIRKDTGALHTLGSSTPDAAPVGAMWYADWMQMKGPDGHTLVVRTPGGDWIVDYKASNSGKPWERTGVPPKITANPSIGIGEGPNGGWKYHGWLRDGVLIEC